MKNIGLLLLLTILAGCSSPGTNTVQRSFLREHPGYAVVGVTKHEWGHYADFTITYKKPPESSEHTDVWHYYYATDESPLSGIWKEPVK